MHEGDALRLSASLILDDLSSATLLGGTWPPLPGGTISDDGDERIVTDPNATVLRKFNRVPITKP